MDWLTLSILAMLAGVAVEAVADVRRQRRYRRLARRPDYDRIAELERELGIGTGIVVPMPALDVEEAPTQRMQADTAREEARPPKGPALPLEEALRGVNEPLRGDLRRLAAWEQNAGRALLAYRYEENGVTVVEIDRVRPTS